MQACKIVSNACNLLELYHNDRDLVGPCIGKQRLLGLNNYGHYDFPIVKREFLLSDFLLFSELSLNSLIEVELSPIVQEKERAAAVKTSKKKNQRGNITSLIVPQR